MVYTFSVVDVKEYISSGILEAVVLGLGSDQEVREVQCLSKIYPEIMEELRAIEQALAKMAEEDSVEPTPRQLPNATSNIAEEAAKIVQLNTGSSSTPWKWMAAASVVLLLGVGTLWILATNRSNELNTQVAELKQQKSADEQVLTAMQLEQEHLKSIQSIVTDHDMSKVILMGTPKDPKACVHFMWSASSNKG